MRIIADNIEELILKSGEFVDLMTRLDEIISNKTQGLKRQLFTGRSITMIGYGEMPWKNSISEGVWPLISMAPQKNSVSLYIAAEKEGIPLPIVYKAQLGKVSVGKNCIRIRKIENLNIDIFQNLIDDAIDWSNNQINKYGRNCAKPIEQ